MKRIICIALSLFLLAGSFSAKVKEKKKKAVNAIAPVNYTSEDAINYEIQNIKKMQEKEPLQALWRAKILQDESKANSTTMSTIQTLYSDCEKKIVARYKKDVSKKNYISALRYFESLEAVDYKELSTLAMQKAQLEERIQKNVPGLSITKESLNTKVGDLIKGTVTVFVDKGASALNSFLSRFGDITIFIDRCYAFLRTLKPQAFQVLVENA